MTTSIQAGAELIAKERQEQLIKHKRSVDYDVETNSKHQLSFAAQMLAHPKCEVIDWEIEITLDGWNKDIWEKMKNKDYKERLVIAGALIAAEIDRLQHEKLNP